MFGISIVIPCKNEEKYISRCIDSLLGQEGEILDREIIVVDNGSTDNTLKILESYGSNISYYLRPDLPIAGLRNYGAEKSTKEWIAFVDADVEVDKFWAMMLIGFLEDQVKKGGDVKNVITGSTCLISNNPTWVEQIWYEQLMIRDTSAIKYINAANLILNRELFNRLGGFDLSYKTGEEEKLCEVARLYHNAVILKHDKIKAIHHGYPKSIATFFKRMRWHGTGMSRYLLKPWKSKPLLLAIYNLILTASFLFLFLTYHRHIFVLFLFIILQFVPVFLYSIKRCKLKIRNVFLLTLLYFCFGWAKTTAIFDIILNREVYQEK